jgi:hypothetical protein
LAFHANVVKQEVARVAQQLDVVHARKTRLKAGGLKA